MRTANEEVVWSQTAVQERHHLCEDSAQHLVVYRSRLENGKKGALAGTDEALPYPAKTGSCWRRVTPVDASIRCFTVHPRRIKVGDSLREFFVTSLDVSPVVRVHDGGRATKGDKTAQRYNERVGVHRVQDF